MLMGYLSLLAILTTYVAGYNDGIDFPGSVCPCAAFPGLAPPSFVGEHYYCESANTGEKENVYYT